MKPADTETANRIPADVLDKLKIHMGNLEKALLEKDPEMPNHLRESHRLLVSYPETVHLLDDTEVRALIDAQQQWTKERIVKDVATGKGSRGKSKITADDL